MFENILEELIDDAFGPGAGEVEFHDVLKYRISYITEKDLNVIFLFVSGLTDDTENIKKELIRCKREFTNLFEDILHSNYDEKTFEVFDPTIDSIHRNLRPKISLVGFSGVGKTTITRLIKAEEIPMEHIPTITGDIATIKIGKLHFHLWDFAGQEQFSYLWTNFIKGSDAVLLITDSTLENVEKSKFFLELIKEQAKHAHSAVIANKQDLEEAMSPEKVENILGLKAYSMIATDPDNRDKMIQIVADVLEMNAQVSPLLKPLLERDELTAEATEALENANFQKAAKLFERISDLCIELGDDSLGREFYEKSQKIKNMLEKAGIQEEVEKKEPVKPEKEEIEEKGEIMEEEKPKIAEKQDKLKKTEEIKETIEETVKKSGFKKPMVKPLPSNKTKEKEGQKEKGKSKEEAEEKPKISAPKPGKVDLQLNPEDFMVKARPKRVGAVPKDAKSKLKTSSYGHVKNKPKKRKPISPSELLREKSEKGEEKASKPKYPESPKSKSVKSSKPTPSKPKKDVSVPTASKSPSKASEKFSKPLNSEKSETTTQDISIESSKSPAQQKDDLEQTLMDLKIKKAKISKMALDFEMQELSGEITTEELNAKKKRLNALENKLTEQIKEISELLD
ncbi:MAG: Small GTP-binding domain protein [Promethearchaeota archaeon]|nr:MAG: Small GTP-binding domain protein [Candidatus Lokiarchaeota archaeon]